MSSGTRIVICGGGLGAIAYFTSRRSAGERGYNLHVARRRVNDAFLRDLLADWQQHGREIIRQVGREAPGTYMKVMALLMPKEMKVEAAQTTISSLTDEQLQAMIAELTERIEGKLKGEDAKVISGQADPQALPPPYQRKRGNRRCGASAPSQ